MKTASLVNERGSMCVVSGEGGIVRITVSDSSGQNNVFETVDGKQQMELVRAINAGRDMTATKK